jgi:hypothetical protein
MAAFGSSLNFLSLPLPLNILFLLIPLSGELGLSYNQSESRK